LEKGKVYLKTRVRYVSSIPQAKPENGEMSMWSRYVHRSSILKYGTEDDRVDLPAGETQYNRPRNMYEGGIEHRVINDEYDKVRWK
jgi:hypothetical protein